MTDLLGAAKEIVAYVEKRGGQKAGYVMGSGARVDEIAIDYIKVREQLDNAIEVIKEIVRRADSETTSPWRSISDMAEYRSVGAERVAEVARSFLKQIGVSE